MNEFIVAEISKNWEGPIDPRKAAAPTEMLCAKFEGVIEVNRRRGYLLHQFQFHRLMTGPAVLNETIIAVFRRREDLPS